MSVALRPLSSADPPVFEAAFSAQDWRKPASQYEKYLAEQARGERLVLVAEIDGEFAGYLAVVWDSGYAPFREAGIPEVCDFNVLVRFQRRGIGTVLLEEAERRISGRSPLAGIGVGLTEDYGAAQVLYVRRGYVPDGRGISHGGKLLVYGDAAPVDDDLVLHLTKRLR